MTLKKLRDTHIAFPNFGRSCDIYIYIHVFVCVCVCVILHFQVQEHTGGEFEGGRSWKWRNFCGTVMTGAINRFNLFKMFQ